MHGAPRFASLAASLAVFIAVQTAAADGSPRAPYGVPAELAPEGLPHQLEISSGFSVTHVVDRIGPPSLHGLQNIEAFTLQSRFLIGRTLAYAGGFDGHVGGSETGAAYGATMFPIGLGLRGDRGAFVALTAGAGFDRIVGSVPAGALLPVDLSFAFPLGPLRPWGWVRPSWIADAPERRRGSQTLSFVDEVEAGVGLRIGRQQTYWARVNAGGGPSIAIAYREFMGARAVGLLLTLDLSGGQ